MEVIMSLTVLPTIKSKTFNSIDKEAREIIKEEIFTALLDMIDTPELNKEYMKAYDKLMEAIPEDKRDLLCKYEDLTIGREFQRNEKLIKILLNDSDRQELINTAIGL